MSRLTILRPGLMMTVQDPGRAGLLSFGVSGSGPIDAEAMEMANALVGNAPGTAALEFAHFGGTLRFDEDRVIAVAGALREIRIDGVAVPCWTGIRIRAGQELSLGGLLGGVWAYLAVSGGLEVPKVLGSAATHLRSGLGGLDGRALVAGDSLPLGPASDVGPGRSLRQIWRSRVGPIRAVPGPQEDRFDPEMQRAFWRGDWRVSARRDRMAMVLEGPQIAARGGHDIVSDGTVAGSVQMPGSGQPIVLLSDRQTTGGYPKIATITSVDLVRLAQTPDGHPVRLRPVPREVAEDLLIANRAAFRAALEDVRGG
ncbi:5-oxoprolinase/urea amidolyase family protein [Pseudooceanicola sp. GBMRC 2024]|uniref:5-oxoprolinase/urea amidolyase family protein n=1 Tax=Pseudooceanicola albus TaxID=2692189 RepID=A0A6L7G061_9RHOB|nr:biotin-dependent carboxyltransferase family protein [Pseudooceanicola albus]MXN17744.1 5-oxoprolinase/urea amidolyase family protein [Pseudooceanicola albus]